VPAKPDVWVGYLCVAISGICFGSNFVPVKWFEKQIGDGIFFQWVFCSAVWFCGFVVYWCRDFPPFQTFVLLGGFLWCTGNILTVPIIRCIGLSLGMLLWGLLNLIMGWLSGSLGWFNLKPEKVEIPWLNILGGLLAMASGIFFALISKNNPETEKHIQEFDHDANSFKSDDLLNHNGDFIDRLQPLQKRIVGVIMSVIAGLLYGTSFVPVQNVIDNCPKCSQSQIDYVFSHFCGIYISSTFYMLLYCLIMKNTPVIPVEIAFPAFLSGLMWSLAMICWFIANTALELIIAYPLVTVLPSIIASAWGIFAFKEISGRRNFFFFGLGFLFTFASIICTVISKGNAQ